MDVLDWIREGNAPYLVVFLLGVLVAVCPCTIAACVSALSCWLKQDKKQFVSLSVSFVLARSIAYSLVGILLASGIQHYSLSESTLSVLGMVAGPLFLLIGLFLLDIFHVHGFENRCINWMNKLFNEQYSVLSAFALGLLLAFAFCPYSAGIYFGAMLPIAMEVSPFLSILFAVGAALPVAFVAWIMYRGMEKSQTAWGNFKNFEYWFRKCIALLFMITGLLFIWEYYLE